MQPLKYKKYTLTILSSVCIACLLSVIWAFTGYFAPEPECSWVDNIYKRKEEYARSINGPKIVIVAGSSGLFGLSAAQIEDHFNIPTVNLATHGDLRDYYLLRAQKNLTPGDLVILTPEYTLYFYNSSMSGVKADYIVNYDKPYLRSLPMAEKLSILQTYANPWKIARNEASHLIDKFRKRNRSRGYDALSLNKNGDETSNLNTKKQISKSVYLPKEIDPNGYVLKKISEFIKWCHRENITVTLTWPGTLAPRSAKEQNQVYTHSLSVYLANLGAEILGEPEDFFVPAHYLYDTVYHLNSKGVEFRTSKLIEILERDPVFTQWRERQKGDFHDPPPDLPSKAPNICYNGDMELSSDKGVSGWRAVVGDKNNPSGMAQWDDTTAHTGKYSVRLDNISGQQVRWIGKKITLPPGIQCIQASAWSKAKDIQDKGIYCVNLKVFFTDGSFKWESRRLHFSKGTHDWEQVKSISCFDEDVAAIEPFLILYSTTGTAWFDDIDISVYAER